MLKKFLLSLICIMLIIGCSHSSAKPVAQGKEVYGDLGGNDIPKPTQIDKMSEYVAIGTAYEYTGKKTNSRLSAKDESGKKVIIVGLKPDGTLEKISVENDEGNQNNLENILSFTKLTDDYSFITIKNSEYDGEINPYNTSMFVTSTVNESDFLINMNTGKMHELKWVYAQITKDLLEKNGLPYNNGYLTDQSYFNGFDGIIRNQLIVSEGNIYVFAYLNLCNSANKSIIKDNNTSNADEWYKKGYIEAYNKGRLAFEGLNSHSVFDPELRETIVDDYITEKYNCSLDDFLEQFIRDYKNNDIEKYNTSEDIHYPQDLKHILDMEASSEKTADEILADDFIFEHFKDMAIDFIYHSIEFMDHRPDGTSSSYNINSDTVYQNILKKYSDATESQKTKLKEGAEKGFDDGSKYEISKYYAETNDTITDSHFVVIYKLNIDETVDPNSDTDSVTATEYHSLDGVEYIRDNKDHTYKGECGYEYYFQLLFANKTLENQIYWDMDGDRNVGFVYDIPTRTFTTNGYAKLELNYGGKTYEFGNLFDDNTNRRSAKGIEFAPFVYGKNFSRFYAFNLRPVNPDGAVNQESQSESVYAITYGFPNTLPLGYVKLAGDNTVADVITLSQELRDSGVVASFVIYGIENNSIKVMDFAQDFTKTISFDEIKNMLSLTNEIAEISLSERDGQCYASVKLDNNETVEAIVSSLGTVFKPSEGSGSFSINQLIPVQKN